MKTRSKFVIDTVTRILGGRITLSERVFEKWANNNNNNNNNNNVILCKNQCLCVHLSCDCFLFSAANAALEAPKAKGYVIS